MSRTNLAMLTRYMQWADKGLFGKLAELPEAELTKARPTRFGNILHTLNHVYVIDRIFQAHLTGDQHEYTARNTPEHPSLAVLAEQQLALDAWYVDYADQLAPQAEDEILEFRFVDGQQGRMSRAEMLLHVVNHATYHRGFVSDTLYAATCDGDNPQGFTAADLSLPANDLTVFLRDVY